VKRRRLSVHFLYLAWPLWQSVLTLAVTGIIFAVVFFGVAGDGVSVASIGVNEKSTKRTVGEL
jgi:hypothetical protein